MSKEVKTVSEISANNYNEIKNMLLSEDEGSRNVALTIMEQADYEKSMLYILCLIKETSSKIVESSSFKFEESYPELHKSILNTINHKADETMSTISFKTCYEVALSRNSQTEIEFMLSIFTEQLVSLLKEYGFTFLDYVDVVVRPKVFK